MAKSKRRQVRDRAYEKEQRKHWPTGGDLTLWQLIKLVLFGRDK